MDTLTFHNMTLTWLEGGITHLDGGAMFGVVPKPVWSKKYPVNERNQIELPTDPILIQYQGKNLLIDSGIGNAKLSEKQRKIFGVTRESEVEASLNTLNLTPEDINFVLMTHMHFDHATGLTVFDEASQTYKSYFPNAKIYIQATEWAEMKAPNIRSKSTYWSMNWEAIADQVMTYEEKVEVLPGISMIHTGGHSDGHALIKLEQDGEVILHIADLMPTHAHKNPLWVLAYDDYPMTSIHQKVAIFDEAHKHDYRFIFYHDAFYRMVRWNEDGTEIIETLERSRKRDIE
ncbi:hypothetical protein CBF34_03860 [Vagococcus penaei]|uniref:Uncharacterized protein n=1 Tax=Vagococcus penaei TaxID=633807 RepID=A0A1Q2D8G5_9ENTE|nr:MBL fold metallo-hydrolase [Vagococcus penaei]AQP54674.1 hypothetical protein BW732_10955 [Vagococcus penaei]RSU05325.1 hypothetical protein CBF34_03860 [Vagococcus penaei]